MWKFSPILTAGWVFFPLFSIHTGEPGSCYQLRVESDLLAARLQAKLSLCVSSTPANKIQRSQRKHGRVKRVLKGSAAVKIALQG